MTTILLTAALLATVPHDDVQRDRVCCIETNAFHDSEAKPVFNQAIFYDFNPRKGRHEVVDWKLIKNRDGVVNIQVRRDYRTGEYVARWDEDGGPREVRALTWKDTQTQTDPELLDRDNLPVDRRRRLSGREDVAGRYKP
jgi:hypothetical protein